jgi:O-antigen/teichoic acid export membrane protein
MSSETAVIHRPAVGRRRDAERLPGAWLLSGAMVVSGILTYVFLVLAARRLGPEAYGRIGVLWGAMFIVAIVVFRPLEQTMSRAFADRLARGEEVRTVMRSVAVLCGVIVAGGTVVTILAWSTVTDRLFGGSNLLTAMLVAGVAAYGFSYLVRGVVGGVRWFNGYGLGLIADAVARLVLAAPLIVVASQSVAAAALVGAGMAGGLIPLCVGRGRLRPAFEGGTGTRFELSSAVAFATPTAVIAASDQLLINGGPLLVMISGGAHRTKEAGVVFAATMLVRAPVYVFQGFAASLLPNLTRLHSTDELAGFRRAVLRTATFLLTAGAVMVVGAAIVGPQAMGLYGHGFDTARGDLVLLAAGVAFYLVASTCSQALLSVNGAVAAAAAWTVSATIFVTAYVVSSGGGLARVSVAFAVATLGGAVLLATLLVRRVRQG